MFAETGYDIAKKEKKIQIQLKQRKVAKEKRAWEQKGKKFKNK